MSILQNLWNSPFIQETFGRTLNILMAPGNNPNMIWILAPLSASILLMEFYFNRYKSEELGWNSAFGNSLVLIFVSLDILRFLSNNGKLSYVNTESALAISVILLGGVLTFMSFFHALPKNLAFGLSSRFPINITAYLMIVIIYGHIPIEIITGIAALIFSIMAWIILKILGSFIPESGEIPELEKIKDD